MAAGGCASTLQQHAQSCARALAENPQHEDLKAGERAFCPCLQTTATVPASSLQTGVQLCQVGSVNFRTLPVVTGTQWGVVRSELTQISFSPSASHLAVVCQLTKHSSSPHAPGTRAMPSSETVSEAEEQIVALYIVDVDDRQTTCIKESSADWLRVYWAPSGECLAAQTSSEISVTSTADPMGPHVAKALPEQCAVAA